MPDTPPDRLSIDPRSPHYNADVLARDVGIRFNGAEKTNVEEYCVSEGWIRVAAGKAKDRFGNPLTIKLKGTVEPYFREPKPNNGPPSRRGTPLPAYSAAMRLAGSTGSSLAAQYLNSGILPNGSSAGLVSRFAAAST